MSPQAQWAIKDGRTGSIIDGTVNDSADEAITVVLDRIGGTTYEALTKINFKLVRVSVTVEIISEI